MRCFNCGTELSEKNEFCPNCGVDVINSKVSSSQLVICETCGVSFSVSLLDRNGYSMECPDCRRIRTRESERKEQTREMQRVNYEESGRSDQRSQRRDARFEVAKCFVRVQLLGITAKILRRDKPQMGPLIDLSITGLQCEEEGDFGKGDPVMIELLVPAFSTPLKMRGNVCWVQSLGGGRVRMGVRFDKTDEKTTAQLRALEKHQALRDAAIIRERNASSSAMLKAVSMPPKERPLDF
ncbi:MAG: PilZ domain-containing protein [Planctomycetes bacterium]|nr:PilZ domain-containing protein [Planctomycetota bacterium]